VVVVRSPDALGAARRTVFGVGSRGSDHAMLVAPTTDAGKGRRPLAYTDPTAVAGPRRCMRAGWFAAPLTGGPAFGLFSPTRAFGRLDGPVAAKAGLAAAPVAATAPADA
jgi:hypothetical protein